MGLYGLLETGLYGVLWAVGLCALALIGLALLCRPRGRRRPPRPRDD